MSGTKQTKVKEDLDVILEPLHIQRGNMQTSQEWLEGAKGRIDPVVYATMMTEYERIILDITKECHRHMDEYCFGD